MARVRKSSRTKTVKSPVPKAKVDNTSVRVTRLSTRKSKESSEAPNVNKSLLKNQSFSSTNSATSPFKGFADNSPPAHPSPFNSDIESLQKKKNEEFNNLFSQNSAVNLHHNIRTYTNKSRDKHFKEEHSGSEVNLLNFEDCRNRNDIILWLNNTENAFDRLTQTQCNATATNEVDVPSTEDMPSVSQLDNYEVKEQPPKRRLRHPRQSPYKVRARSLEIQIKKNAKGGRKNRHSDGDKPTFENYQIEEPGTDDDVCIPAALDAKHLINLMEDEYLQNIENDVLQPEEKKNQSFTGWDRIKDMNKTINRKQPKQLKVVVQSGDKRNDQSNRSYDNDILEEYFCKNMQLIENEEHCKDEDDCSENAQPMIVPNKQKCLLNNALKLGNEFVVALRKLKDDDRSLEQFHTLFSDLEMIFQTSTNNVSYQTSAVQKSDQYIQTEHTLDQKSTQIQPNSVDKEIQASTFDAHKSVQTCVSSISVEIQTEEKVFFKPISRTSSATCSTPSCIFLLDKNDNTLKKLDDDANIELKDDDMEEIEKVDDLFGAEGLEFEFNTEEFLVNDKECNGRDKKESLKVSQARNENNEGSKRTQSETKQPYFEYITEELVNNHNKSERSKKETPSPEVRYENNKGVKRSQLESPIPVQPMRNKRPCAKFIDEELSVNFSTCRDEDYRKPDEEVSVAAAYVAKVLERDTKVGIFSRAESKTRTQEQMEELENMIYNVNKRSVHRNPSGFQSIEPAVDDDLDDLEYFKSSSPNQCATPKTIRKRLFEPKSGNKFSESMFDSESDETFVNNIDCDNENIASTPSRAKIKILDNIVIKCAASVQGNLSDEDVVESTPQKKNSSLPERRGDSVLNITLPPPFEFQDTEKMMCGKVASLDSKTKHSTPRRPLMCINKITSTPFSQRRESPDILSLSPIQKLHSQQNKSGGSFERSKFSPLTIIKRSKSESSQRSSATYKQKSILQFIRSTPEFGSDGNQSFTTSKSQTKPCISCSRLSRDEVRSIHQLCNKNLATYSSMYNSKVTHMIVATDNNCITGHTIKVIQAIAAGIWVLNINWVQDSVKENSSVPEESYEVLDITGIPGPKRSRTTRNGKRLLEGFKIYVAPPFETTAQSAIESVINILGGKVVKYIEDLLDKNGVICIILTEVKRSQEFAKYEAWLDGLGVVTVDMEWLCRCVAQYEIVTLRPFVLCGEDNLESLGYPPELMLSVSYSSSQPTAISVPSSP